MPTRTAVHTDEAPKAIGPYSQAIRAGKMIFCSGQVAIDPGAGTLVSGDVRLETRQVMSNLAAVLRAAGGGLEDVVKTTIFLTDLGDYAQVNEVYAESFQQEPPARAAVQVAALPLGARVEIEAVAVVD